MEVDLEWGEAIKSLRDEFPFQRIEPREDNFGIAFLSKFEILSEAVAVLDDSGVPSLVVDIQKEGRRLRIYRHSSSSADRANVFEVQK